MFLILVLCLLFISIEGFSISSTSSRNMIRFGTSYGIQSQSTRQLQQKSNKRELSMNFFGDAMRFFSNMNKEASAKHILIKGPSATQKCEEYKAALEGQEDLSNAFSELAAKVSECPSANRGGNLGTFKPGMMVKEFDKVCFEKEIGVVHGPVETQFGSHLILITRRYEGEDEKK